MYCTFNVDTMINFLYLRTRNHCDYSHFSTLLSLMWFVDLLCLVFFFFQI